MCGLVGVFGNIFQKDLNYFRDALVADSVRGYHSTGVCATSVDKKKQQYATWYHKDTLTGAEAVGDRVFKDVYDDINNWAVMGHNRWATTGAVNSDNAHPFCHGSITLMHNGTLDTMIGLKGSHATDSERICDSIANRDVVSVLESLEGAFALVWLNSENNTINFARNKERPLAMIHSTNKDIIYYASEGKMMEWCLDRNHVPTGANEVFPLPVGEWWSYPIEEMGKGRVLEPNVVKFTPAESYNWQAHYKHSSTFVPKRVEGVPNAGAGFEFTIDSIIRTSTSKDRYNITGTYLSPQCKRAHVTGYWIEAKELNGVKLGDSVQAEVSSTDNGRFPRISPSIYIKAKTIRKVEVTEREKKTELAIIDTQECDNCFQHFDKSLGHSIHGTFLLCKDCEDVGNYLDKETQQ